MANSISLPNKILHIWSGLSKPVDLTSPRDMKCHLLIFECQCSSYAHENRVTLHYAVQGSRDEILSLDREFHLTKTWNKKRKYESCHQVRNVVFFIWYQKPLDHKHISPCSLTFLQLNKSNINFWSLWYFCNLVSGVCLSANWVALQWNGTRPDWVSQL